MYGCITGLFQVQLGFLVWNTGTAVLLEVREQRFQGLMLNMADMSTPEHQLTCLWCTLSAVAMFAVLVHAVLVFSETVSCFFCPLIFTCVLLTKVPLTVAPAFIAAPCLPLCGLDHCLSWLHYLCMVWLLSLQVLFIAVCL